MRPRRVGRHVQIGLRRRPRPARRWCAMRRACPADRQFERRDAACASRSRSSRRIMHVLPDERGLGLEQSHLESRQRAVAVVHRDEAQAHEQERESQAKVVVVVHAAEQHREHHRGVGEAGAESAGCRCDGGRVRPGRCRDPGGGESTRCARFSRRVRTAWMRRAHRAA